MVNNILFIQGLHDWLLGMLALASEQIFGFSYVDQTSKSRVVLLLHYFRSGLQSIVLRGRGFQPESVHRVAFRELVSRSQDELEFRDVHADSAQQLGDRELVLSPRSARCHLSHVASRSYVFGAVPDELCRTLQCINHGMNVGQKNLDFTSCLEERCDLQCWYKVSAVRTSCSRRTPVDNQRPFLLFKYLLDDLRIEHLLQIVRDQSVLLFWSH